MYTCITFTIASEYKMKHVYKIIKIFSQKVHQIALIMQRKTKNAPWHGKIDLEISLNRIRDISNSI